MTLSLGILLIVTVASALFLRWRSRSEGYPAHADAEVLKQLASAGSDLSKSHSIDFYLDFPARNEAEKAAAILRADGFGALAAEANDGSGWVCHATKEVVPALATIVTIGERLQAIALSGRGDYGGWGAPVTK